MDEKRAFEIARRYFPSGEPIVTMRRAAKAALEAVAEAVPADAALTELRGAAAHGIEAGDRSHAAAWRRVLEIVDRVAPGAPAIGTSEQGRAVTDWPKERDVGRVGDMHPSAHLRVGLDADNDVYVSVWDNEGGGSVEFCCPGAGGGKSARTREALIALMVAIEADNAEFPRKDWWALRRAPESV